MIDPASALRELERAGNLVRGELRPGGSEREWCDPEVLRRLRRASLAVLRKEIEPADQRAFASFLSSWQGIDRQPASGAGVDRLREVLVPLQGLALPAEVWERDVLPRRTGAYSPTWLDQLCAAGELVWVGAGTLGRTTGRVALYFREDLPVLGPPPSRGEPPADPGHLAIRERLATGAAFFTDLLVDVDLAPEDLQEALWDLVWAGEVTNDAWAPLRAPRLTLARAQREQARRGGRSRRFGGARGAQAQIQGRWSLTEPLFRRAADPAERRRAQAELLLERYGIVTRERVLAEGIPGGFSAVYEAPIPARDARQRPARLLHRGAGRRAVRAPGSGRAPSRAEVRRAGASAGARGDRSRSALRRGAAGAQARGEHDQPARRRAARVRGAYVVLAGAEPVIYVEKGGKGLSLLVAGDDERLRPALEALADFVRAGRIKRLCARARRRRSGGGPRRSRAC